MKKRRKRIDAECPLFACRECRTKAGWPHQSWCTAEENAKPFCVECLYVDHSGGCTHPAKKRKERAESEEDQSSVRAGADA